MLNSFAIHFLAPRSGVASVWRRSAASTKDRATIVAATYQLSWTAALGQLRNLDLITDQDRRSIEPTLPSRADFVRLGLTLPSPLAEGQFSPDFGEACLRAYQEGRLSADRTIELLRGALTVDELPAVPVDLGYLYKAVADESW